MPKAYQPLLTLSMTLTSIPASIACPLGCYSSFPATWAPVVCSRQVSQRELLIKEISICHSSTSHIQGLSFDLTVKAEVTTVASKQCPTQTSPSLHSSASSLSPLFCLFCNPAFLVAQGLGPGCSLGLKCFSL